MMGVEVGGSLLAKQKGSASTRFIMSFRLVFSVVNGRGCVHEENVRHCCLLIIWKVVLHSMGLLLRVECVFREVNGSLPSDKTADGWKGQGEYQCRSPTGNK